MKEGTKLDIWHVTCTNCYILILLYVSLITVFNILLYNLINEKNRASNFSF